MKKKIWLTSLEKTEKQAQQTVQTLGKYGLQVNGHFWEDDLDNMAWAGLRKKILDENIDLWLISGTAQSFAHPANIYGLSLLILVFQSMPAGSPQVHLLQEGDSAISLESMPSHFSNCTILKANSSSLGAKIVASVHKKPSISPPPYRFDVYGIPQIGQWFEVGPRQGEWQGVIFATSDPAISMHAVGPAGRLPEKSTLNYPQQGLKINFDSGEFDGWAVQNSIDAKTSYFVRVDTHPQTILFLPFSQDDETEAFVLNLK